MPSGDEDVLLAIMQFPTSGKVIAGGGQENKRKEDKAGEKNKRGTEARLETDHGKMLVKFGLENITEMHETVLLLSK